MEKQKVMGTTELFNGVQGWGRWRAACPPTVPPMNPCFRKAHWLQGLPGLPPWDLPDTLTEAPASMIPLLGRTQYLRGAVVFTLKHTFRSVGFPSFKLVVTTSVKGPVE